MNAVDDIATVISDLTGSFTVQKDFFQDDDVAKSYIVIRAAGGSYASLIEGQAVEIMVINEAGVTVVGLTAIESIKTRLIGNDWVAATVGIYQCDIVGGIMPVMMRDGRTGYTLNVIARYTRDEAIK